jgi:hypothetical protein
METEASADASGRSFLASQKRDIEAHVRYCVPPLEQIVYPRFISAQQY